MKISRILYSKTKRCDYRLIFSDNTLNTEDKNYIFRDCTYCFSRINEIISCNHLLIRSISNNRYILYKFFATNKKDSEGRSIFALSGFLLDLEGVRSLSFIASDFIFNLANYERKLSDKDKNLIEVIDYSKENAFRFCESDIGQTLEKSIREFILSDDAPLNFLITIMRSGEIKFNKLDL